MDRLLCRPLLDTVISCYPNILSILLGQFFNIICYVLPDSPLQSVHPMSTINFPLAKLWVKSTGITRAELVMELSRHVLSTTGISGHYTVKLFSAPDGYFLGSHTIGTDSGFGRQFIVFNLTQMVQQSIKIHVGGKLTPLTDGFSFGLNVQVVSNNICLYIWLSQVLLTYVYLYRCLVLAMVTRPSWMPTKLLVCCICIPKAPTDPCWFCFPVATPVTPTWSVLVTFCRPCPSASCTFVANETRKLRIRRIWIRPTALSIAGQWIWRHSSLSASSCLDMSTLTFAPVSRIFHVQWLILIYVFRHLPVSGVWHALERNQQRRDAQLVPENATAGSGPVATCSRRRVRAAHLRTGFVPVPRGWQLRVPQTWKCGCSLLYVRLSFLKRFSWWCFGTGFRIFSRCFSMSKWTILKFFWCISMVC